MMKRPHVPDDGTNPPKRRRPEEKSQELFPVEEIQFARQLRSLLTFRQDGIQELRSGIASFKALLEKILYNTDTTSNQAAKTILKEYLDSEKPRQGEELEHPFLSQLWQAWSFANSNNNDHLSSAVCAILALLLKTLASALDLKDHGTLLCRTVLQHQHLRHIKRCLDAPKHKEFLLSPSLRLLSELASFDGGVNVREMYKRREQTFDVAAIRKCLTITKVQDSTQEDVWRRPAVRTVSVRYILLHLKYQDEGAKADILRQRPLIGTLFGFFQADPPELIIEILRTAEMHVFKDNNLPRSAKAALLTEQQLLRVTEVATRSDNDSIATPVALQWLTEVVTTPSYGILRPCGWYPPGTARHGASDTLDPNQINLGVESLESDTNVSLRNPILAAWLKELRPGSNPAERDLALSCFRAAPELVHDYFRDSTLQMEPKLTNTWIGYASFMFEVVALPIPQHIGNVDADAYAERPPRIDHFKDSILPKPLSLKVLTRCLNQNSKLISFFAVRLLVIALKKVRAIVDQVSMAADASTHAQAWAEFRTLLITKITDMVPKAKDVASVYRGLAADEMHLLQREAAAKLLKLYHEVLPDAAAEEAFDISSVLLPLLDDDAAEATAVWKAAELADLLTVAQHSTTLRWFQRQSGSPVSPITSLLRRSTHADQPDQIRSVTRSVLEQSAILEQRKAGEISAFDALIYSLKGVANESVIWQHLDDCLVRATKMPVKYLDDADEIKNATSGSDNSVSLLLLVILEQAPFVVKKKVEERTTIMKWINCFFALLRQTAEHGPLLEAIADKITQTGDWLNEVVDTNPEFAASFQIAEREELVDVTPIDDGLPFEMPAKEGTDHPELFRWQRKDLDQALDDGDVDGLIICLSSGYTEVRKQARGQIEKLSLAVYESSLEEKEQVYLLIGELLETYTTAYEPENKPMPHLLSTFAVLAIHIQLEPTHLMYPKLNRFLMKGPAWRPSAISRYWLSATVLSVPTDDDGHWAEVQWTLDWLVSGLQSQQDFDLLRSAGSFERIMAVHAATSPAQKQLRSRVLELIYRAALIDSVSLVTRTGSLSWLQTLHGDVPRRIRNLIKQKGDVERVESWTGIPLEVI